MQVSSKGKVVLPTEGITVRRSGKYPYVYKILKAYRNEEGKPTNDRIRIGTLDIQSGLLIPNANYWELYGNADIPESFPSYQSVRAIGASYAVSRILQSLGVDKILESVCGKSRAQNILTAAIYMVCRGNIFERVYDWCEGYTFDNNPLNSTTASMLFSSITFDERMQFFKAWIAVQLIDSLLAYDVTSFSTHATCINDAEWGYNRDKDNLPQINLSCYLGHESHLPMFYVTYPGSITDKTHLPYMMAYNEELGIIDVTFSMDRGFCKTDNIKYMHSSPSKTYIIGAELSHKASFTALKEVREDIVSMKNSISQGVYGRAIHSRFYGVTTTLHIYFDPNSAEGQRQTLYRTIESEEHELSRLEAMTKKEFKHYNRHFDIDLKSDGSFSFSRNYFKIDEVAKNLGFFGIFTNTGANSENVLADYRRKDVIEKGFDELKNHIDMKRLRTHNDTTTEGKMFCAFIALIAVSKMSTLLTDFMKSKSMSKDGLISELEKIKIVTMSDGTRLMNPLTKTQRTIFNACGLTEDTLNAFVYAG